MKKILYLLTVFLIFSLDVYAYTEIDQYYFKLIMDKAGYTTDIFENGVYACLEGTEICDESFVYTNYDTETKAKEEFKNLFDTSGLNIIEKNIIASYNLDDSESENYSYIQFDFTENGSSVHSYYYIFRINKSVISGQGDISEKEKIDSIINQTIDDSVQERADEILDSLETNEENQEKPQIIKKKSNNHDYTLLVIGIILLIVIILATITFIIKRNKKKQSLKRY